MSLKNHIEALLFLTDKPIKAAVIARTLNQDVQDIRKAMLELINDYETRNSALEIADEDGYMLQVKDEFSGLVDEFAPFELPTSLVRTLSAIAIKQPVAQSEVIKLRGAGAYDHIKELIARELIHRREDGRSPLLTTTKKFQEYFRLSKDGQTWRHQLETATNKDRPEEEQISLQKDVQLELFDAPVASGLDADTEAQIQAVVDADNHVYDTSPSAQSQPEVESHAEVESLSVMPVQEVPTSGY
ncbi:MAG: segregation and condensation protein [Cyanobacteriota bacterium erpe_2018_sw_21hr_WHONDRS-SW48-000092_B_bin.40]|jgi:segregation and condensation protein B|nr:segregation and condensation protein [Cyanobacteriota bacterium erpe_2018_sw_21hr_WHONDRS-SW48-000092_B_bin.40]